MSNRTLADEVITLIQSQSNNNPAPISCKITKVYDDFNHVDAEIDSGTLTYVETIGNIPVVGSKGIVVFLDGNLDNSVIIPSSINKWVKTELNSYASLYVNAHLRLCKLRYSRSFGSATADTFYTWHEKLIPTAYRPPHQCHGNFNHVGTLVVKANGDILGKFANSWSGTSRSVIGDVWWYY